MKTRPSPPNSFRFKQFTVEQSNSEMKVGFDGILLGAWAHTRRCQRILDIGTGTGLVALMLAQRTQTPPHPKNAGQAAIVDAIEIDELAAEEAARNFQNSPWHHRLKVEATSLQEFAATGPAKYDLIVCNPPFYSSHVASGNARRQLARQDVSLDFSTLCALSVRLLKGTGCLAVIVPKDRESAIHQSASDAGLLCRRQLRVRSLPHKPPHRILLQYERADRPTEMGISPLEGHCELQDLTIEERHHEYTAAFKRLAKDFYLAF